MSNLKENIQSLKEMANKAGLKISLVEDREWSDPSGMTKRQAGAYKATITKGLENLSMEQYAVIYIMLKYGRFFLPGAYKNASNQEISEGSGININTLSLNGAQMSKVIKGVPGAAEQFSKANDAVIKFDQMDKNTVSNIASKAFVNKANKDSQPKETRAQIPAHELEIYKSIPAGPEKAAYLQKLKSEYMQTA